MSDRRWFDYTSLGITILSLITTIGAGLFGPLYASLVSLAILIFTWLIWLTVSIIFVQKKLRDTRRDLRSEVEECMEDTPKRSKTRIIPYMPTVEYIKNNPERILVRNDKYRVRSDFLEYDQYTILFWVKLEKTFINSPTNRYLFAYTTNPLEKDKENNHKYPNAFYLRIHGKQKRLEYVIKGPDYKNSNVIYINIHQGLVGWKMISVRWFKKRETIEFNIDADFIKKNKKIDKMHRPLSLSGQDLHLGGWLDDWDGGISRLEFFNFRIFNTHLADSELKEIYDSEKPNANDI